MKPFQLKSATSKTLIEKGLKSVYLANLNYKTSSTDIYYLATDFGEVEYVDMPVTNDGKSNKGYCFVKFKDAEKAE